MKDPFLTPQHGLDGLKAQIRAEFGIVRSAMIPPVDPGNAVSGKPKQRQPVMRELPERRSPQHAPHPFKQGATQGCTVCGKRINDPIHSTSAPPEPGKGTNIDVTG